MTSYEISEEEVIFVVFSWMLDDWSMEFKGLLGLYEIRNAGTGKVMEKCYNNINN